MEGLVCEGLFDDGFLVANTVFEREREIEFGWMERRMMESWWWWWWWWWIRQQSAKLGGAELTRVETSRRRK